MGARAAGYMDKVNWRSAEAHGELVDIARPSKQAPSTSLWLGFVLVAVMFSHPHAQMWVCHCWILSFPREARNLWLFTWLFSPFRIRWGPSAGWVVTSDALCVLVSQWCLTLCDPMGCSPPGSSIHGIFQARILEWVAISFLTQGSNLSLVYCRQTLYCLIYQGSPSQWHTNLLLDVVYLILFMEAFFFLGGGVVFQWIASYPLFFPIYSSFKLICLFLQYWQTLSRRFETDYRLVCKIHHLM